MKINIKVIKYIFNPLKEYHKVIDALLINNGKLHNIYKKMANEYNDSLFKDMKDLLDENWELNKQKNDVLPYILVIPMILLGVSIGFVMGILYLS